MARNVRIPATQALAVYKFLTLPSSLRLVVASSARAFSVLQRPPPKYDGHVPLNNVERGALAAGSAVMSLMDPYRGGKLFVVPKPTILWLMP